MTAMMSGFHGRYGGFSQQTWSKKTKFLIPCSGRTVARNVRNELADKNNKGAAFGSNLFAYRSAEKFLSVAENQMGAKKMLRHTHCSHLLLQRNFTIASVVTRVLIVSVPKTMGYRQAAPHELTSRHHAPPRRATVTTSWQSGRQHGARHHHHLGIFFRLAPTRHNHAIPLRQNNLKRRLGKWGKDHLSDITVASLRKEVKE